MLLNNFALRGMPMRIPHETYPMTDSDVDRWRDQFEEPDAEELAGAAYPLPSHWHSWLDWAADRWPSLSTE